MSTMIANVSTTSGRHVVRPISVPPGLTNAAEFFCIEFVAAAQCALLNSRTAFLQLWDIDVDKYFEVAYIENEALRSAVRGYVERKLERGRSLETFCLRELLDICLHRQREQRIIDRLFLLCASNELVEELFGVSRNKARFRRKTLGCTRPSRVKAQACPSAVLDEWIRATRSGLPLGERYIAVCEATGEYPDIVKRVVIEHEYDDDALLLSTPPQRTLRRHAV